MGGVLRRAVEVVWTNTTPELATMTEPKCTRPPSPLTIAVPALAGQGVYGQVTTIANDNDISRQRVYRIREIARAAIEQGGSRWGRYARREEAPAAARHLVEVCGEGADLERVVGLVFPILHERHRASSAVENVHSVLRPHLVVQKSVNQ